MNLFPIQLNVSSRKCVVVGGGGVAARKAASLLECGAQVMVVAPEVRGSLREMADAGQIVWRREEYSAECLAGAFLLFAATDSKEVNARAVRDAQAQGILACDVSAPDRGDFVSPSVLRRGNLTLTVSTGGGSPTLAAVLGEDLAAQFGPEWAALTALVGALRPAIQAAGDEAARRMAVRRIVADTQVRALLRQGQKLEAMERARECLSHLE